MRQVSHALDTDIQLQPPRASLNNQASIHSDRNRSERLWGGGGRSAVPGAYTSVCEEREHRPILPRSRAVDLCRYV